MQFAYDSPYRFAPPLMTSLGPVNNFQDLVVDKLLAFFGRAEPRDAVDLFFILETEDFGELAELAVKKDPGFDLYWLAAALEKAQTFPDELERWPVEMLQPLDPVQVKGRLRRLALDIMAKLQQENNDPTRKKTRE